MGHKKINSPKYPDKQDIFCIKFIISEINLCSVYKNFVKVNKTIMASVLKKKKEKVAMKVNELNILCN